VMTDVNVFGARVCYRIVCKFDSTFIVTQEWDF
jgi:hypothetical protein